MTISAFRTRCITKLPKKAVFNENQYRYSLQSAISVNHISARPWLYADELESSYLERDCLMGAIDIGI
jgi:hypothetical protein